MNSKLALLVLLLTVFNSSKVYAKTSRVFQLELSENCLLEYEFGTKVYQEAIKNRSDIDSFEEHLSQESKNVEEDCLTEYTLGALEEKAMTTQYVMIEYLLEKENILKYSPQGLEFITNLYKRRMEELFVNSFDFENLNFDITETKKTLYEYAKKKRTAIPFGRFVFTPKERRNLQTLFDYQFYSSGNPKRNHYGELDLKEGTYNKYANWIASQIQKNAEEYLRWKPSIWFGEDSFIYGMFWLKDGEKNLRQIKEEGYFNSHRQLARYARDAGMDQKAILDVERVMLDKSVAYLDRDIKVLKTAQIGFIAAPLVPLAMYASAPLFAYVGASKFVAGSSMLSVGSLLSASNLSAASALAGLSAMTIYNYSQTKEAFDSTGAKSVKFADRLFVSAIAAMPVAAISPLAVGGTLAGGKYLIGELGAFLGHIKSGFKFAKGLSGAQVKKLIPKIPGKVVKAWVKSWWKIDKKTGKKVFDKGFVALYLSGNAANFVAEFVDRSFFRKEEEHKFFVDGKINKYVLMNMIPSMTLDLLASPIFKFKNFFSRYVAYRMLSLVTTPLTSMIFEKDHKIDWDYVKFNWIYFAGVGTAIGEAQRPMLMNIMNNSKLSPVAQTVIFTSFKLGLTFPKTSLRNLFMESYLEEGKMIDVAKFKSALNTDLNLQIKGFSDSEVEAFISDFMATQEFIDWVNTQEQAS